MAVSLGQGASSSTLLDFAPVTEESGQLIAGRYRLGRCLARGGMGSVWEAEHVELESRVAVKLLRAELGENSAHVERFRREARTAAKLKSPHVVSIFDSGFDHGMPYIAMEFLEGEDLELRLRRVGRLELDEALKWLDQAARALAVAHAAHLVHRDIKPANLFIERHAAGERLKVVDFGIARPLASEESLTTGGGVWGSPAYMSPEQARGRLVDQRTDVWALAGVFYRMVTGELPFPGVTEHDTIVEVCTGHARPPSEHDPSLPPALDAFFVRAFAKDPAERTPSVELLAQEAAEALELVLPPFETPSSRPSIPSRDSTASPPPQAPVGRMTETQPLGGDTGPTGVTAPSAVVRPSSSRRWLSWALGAALLLGALFVWQRESERPLVVAPDAQPATTPQEAAEPALAAPQGLTQTSAAPPLAPPPDAAAAASSAAPAALTSVPPATSRPHEPKRAAKPSAPVAKPAAAPSKSAQESPEEPATDPLFGLPLERNDTK